MLAALRRSGDPFTLTPGQLSTSLLVTTGAISKRIDRLETRGLVRRTVSDADARGRRVTLTTAGVDLTDQLIGEHLTNEARLLASLSTTERDQLATLLGRLAATMENRPDTEPVQTGEHR
ncbi:MAG: MarR family transcriptional regulator [Humibacillus sp.]|nr:MarR family transcriptional regulator [Humibacillus sp.]MDN5777921.1 MarR family transcriptional regulator [Humibacillus sp.]